MEKYLIKKEKKFLEVSSTECYSYYEYRSKNKYGQTAICNVYKVQDQSFPPFTFNFDFCIKRKRKDDFNEGKITGRGEIESLIWAKDCLMDFYSFMKEKCPGYILVADPANKRLEKIYSRYLIPEGFKLSKTKHKYLYKK